MHLGALLATALGAMGAVAAHALDIVPPLPLESDLGYEFGGSTVLGRHSIRLTGDIRGERGWIVSRPEAQLPESFVLELDFRVDGEAKNLYGDGMALWFLDAPQIREGSMMGLSEFYNGVAIVLDTYRNGKGGRLFPRLQVLRNDGTQAYDRDNDGRSSELASCGMRGIHNNNRQDATLLRLEYSAIDQKLTAEVNYRNKWETCFAVNVPISRESRVALSAATGDLHEAHTIKRLTVVSADRGEQPLYVAHKPAPGALPRTGAAAAPVTREGAVPESFSPSPSFVRRFFRFAFRLALLAALVYAAFFGLKTYKKYRQSQEDARFKLS